ncbi:PREDICTED: acidic leucine-rich nuclear phosphoprotein 32 family member E-like, partial [Rhagoletis zephyria]|uniref:acidic leucine-rich nuclear phosphoprotein 32 family member E-like n=1 Tax=Rhagoletis zephyria TaxID=28612 RepID=UPI0008117C8D
SFLEMMKHTELQEGIMVRCIQRVDELLKNIRLAAKNLESKEFEEKLERASRLIRRDIVFAPSLYTVQDGVVGVFEEEEESRPQTVEEEEEEEGKLVVGVTEGKKKKKKNADDNSVEGDQGEEKFDEDDEDDDDEDDALFTYDFGAVKEDEELEGGNGGKFQEEEQFNSNFL